jgi:CBS domain-containing protein
MSAESLSMNVDDIRKQFEESSRKYRQLEVELAEIVNGPQSSKSPLKEEEIYQNGSSRDEEVESIEEDMEKYPDIHLESPPGLVRSRRPASIHLARRLELLANPPETLKGVFENYQVGEIALCNWLRKRPVLISDTQTIERALSRINAHEVHSLPVVDMNKDVIGVIDILDITLGIALSLKNKPVQVKVRNEFMMRTVGSLFLQKHTKSYVISNRSSLWEAAEKLVQSNQERFLIVDREVQGEVEAQTQPEPHVDGILTASDILRFLTQNVYLMRKEPLMMKKLKDLGLGTRTPKTCYLSDIAGHVFTVMGETGCAGVAVLNNEGKLHANLSASDLKGLTRKNVNILSGTVENYILRDRKRGWWVKPVVVTMEETLISAVLQFVCAKCHRMYIVDEDFHPIGEISHHDILKELMKIR